MSNLRITRSMWVILTICLVVTGSLWTTTPSAATPRPGVRSSVLVAYGSSDWRYTTLPKGSTSVGFFAPNFDDSSWPVGQAGFGTNDGTCSWNNPAQVKTAWTPLTDLYIRKHLTVPAGTASMHIDGSVDNGATIFLNGTQIGVGSGEFCSGGGINLDIPASAILPGADNVLAIGGNDDGSATFLDVQVSVSAPNIYGGTPIDVLSTDGRATEGGCTAGYAAKSITTGALYMVTANHCRNVLDPITGIVTDQHANPVNIFPAGNRTNPLASLLDCTPLRTACLWSRKKPSDAIAWAPDMATPSPQVFTGLTLSDVVGESNYREMKSARDPVCWTGRTSKVEKCARVLGRWSDLSTKERVKVLANGGSLIPVLYQNYVIIQGSKILQGDSGSLMYEKAATGVLAAGIASASNSSLSPYSLFLPVQTIDAHLGVRTLTAVG